MSAGGEGEEEDGEIRTPRAERGKQGSKNKPLEAVLLQVARVAVPVVVIVRRDHVDIREETRQLLRQLVHHDTHATCREREMLSKPGESEETHLERQQKEKQERLEERIQFGACVAEEMQGPTHQSWTTAQSPG